MIANLVLFVIIKIAKELLAEEDVRITAESKKRKAKKKEKQLSMVKKAVEVADESDGKVLEENKEKGSGSNLVEEREPPEVRSCYLSIH